MPPAARIGDLHTCPMVNPGPVPHVGGPILSGAPTVLIGFMPAARVSDTALCVPATDAVAKGSSNVVIANKDAARIGDTTNHGGIIVMGCPTVIIGESPQSFSLKGAAKSGAPVCEECEKAKKAAEELAKKEQDSAPPPNATPQDSTTEAPPAGAAPAASTAPAAPAAPTPEYGPPPPPPTNEEKAMAATPGDTAAQRQAREKVLRDFYHRNGLKQADADQDMGVGGSPPRPNGNPIGYGIDLGKPLSVVHFPPPDVMYQHVRKSVGRPGNFFDPVGGQTGDALGLNTDTNIRKYVAFKMPPGEGLLSSNGPITDTWTDKANPVNTKGGGTQLNVGHHIKLAALCHCHNLQPCPK